MEPEEDVVKQFIKSLQGKNKAQRRLLTTELLKAKQSCDKISANDRLYRWYIKYTKEGMRFDVISDAINNYCDDKILVYFAEIDKYGVFEYGDYCELVQKIKDVEEDDDIKLPFSPKQIILSDRRQKVVLICSGENSERIQQCAREFFNSDIRSSNKSNDEIEITIDNKTAPNFDDALKAFREFYEYIYKKDAALSDKIRMPKLHLCGDKKYIQKDISVNDYIKIEDLVKILATIPPTNNIQIVINNGCNVQMYHGGNNDNNLSCECGDTA